LFLGGTQKDRELEMLLAEMIPSSKLELSFWDKFYELVLKMLLVNQENVQSHMYASDPTKWPFLTKGIAYWVSQKTNVSANLIYYIRGLKPTP
jgi:dolichyl-phosphate-mannose-protein mannosyltransferase